MTRSHQVSSGSRIAKATVLVSLRPLDVMRRKHHPAGCGLQVLDLPAALRQRCQTLYQLLRTQPGSRLPSSTLHMVLSRLQQVLSTHREARTPAPPTGSWRLSLPAVSHPHCETPLSTSEALGRLPKTSL